MPDHGHVQSDTATVEQRVDAIQAAFDERGMKPAEFIDEFRHLAEETVGAGERRARRRQGVDRSGVPAAPARQRPRRRRRARPRRCRAHHRHLVVLENTPTVQNVICCTLCSCTAFTIIGLPPDWYKDLEYRARVVRQSRTVLKEMGLELPADDRDPRLGHHRRHALHGAAGAAAATPSAGPRSKLAGDRHQGLDDRRRAPLATESTMDGIHDLGGRQGFGRVRYSPDAPGLPRAVGEARQRALLARGAGSASSTWTSTATRSSAWSRATTCRPATTSAR